MYETSGVGPVSRSDQSQARSCINNASLALQIADYGYVLQAGRIALSGPARDLLHDPRIRDAYLGGQAA